MIPRLGCWQLNRLHLIVAATRPSHPSTLFWLHPFGRGVSWYGGETHFWGAILHLLGLHSSIHPLLWLHPVHRHQCFWLYWDESHMKSDPVTGTFSFSPARFCSGSMNISATKRLKILQNHSKLKMHLNQSHSSWSQRLNLQPSPSLPLCTVQSQLWWWGEPQQDCQEKDPSGKGCLGWVESWEPVGASGWDKVCQFSAAVGPIVPVVPIVLVVPVPVVCQYQ